MTTEEKAKVYANEIEGRFSDDFLDTTHLYHECRKAYLAGAAEALRSQWKDASKELPEEGKDVLTHSEYGVVIGSYDEPDKIWFGLGFGIINPTHWMELPPLPDTEEQ